MSVVNDCTTSSSKNSVSTESIQERINCSANVSSNQAEVKLLLSIFEHFVI